MMFSTFRDLEQGFEVNGTALAKEAILFCPDMRRCLALFGAFDAFGFGNEAIGYRLGVPILPSLKNMRFQDK